MRNNASTVSYVMHARSANMYGSYKPVQAASKSSYRKCSIKKIFLKISQNSQGNTCVRVSLFNIERLTGLTDHLSYKFHET